jgi:hypothetical protein
MTGSDEYSNTRPISVAELLAKNGTIGAPPVGGRRRRRRGNADAVTVAELTGEIPIVRPDEPAPTRDEQQVEQVAPDDQDTVTGNGEVLVAEPETEPEHEPQADVETEPEPETETEIETEAEAEAESESESETDELADAAEVTEADDELVEFGDIEPEAEDQHEDEDEYADAVAEYAAHVEHRDAEADPVEFVAPPRRSPFGRFGRKNSAAVDAELMSPDPIDAEAEDTVDDLDEAPVAEQDAEVDAAALDNHEDTDTDTDTEDTGTDTQTETTDDELPSYLRSTADPLFGGETVADDVARRGTRPSPEDLDLDEEDEEEDQPREMSPLVHGLWVVGQSVVAVVFGAGLFVAFDQLWKWNNIVALVLSVLVILGLVVGVRVVRKTEDIGSTLIAVAVGALVTLGPLALLQSG